MGPVVRGRWRWRWRCPSGNEPTSGGDGHWRALRTQPRSLTLEVSGLPSPWTKVGICPPPGSLSSLRPHGPQERGQAPDRSPSRALQRPWRGCGRCEAGSAWAQRGSRILGGPRLWAPPAGSHSSTGSRVGSAPPSASAFGGLTSSAALRLVPSPRAWPSPPLPSVRPSSALWCRPQDLFVPPGPVSAPPPWAGDRGQGLSHR